MRKKQRTDIPLLKDILPLFGVRPDCDHAGEVGEHCGKCGADLRVVASYECRLCSLMARPKIYPAENVPNFCIQCGAPKFTFAQIRKKRSKKSPEPKKKSGTI